jgi:FeS assembly SUF system protein
MSQSESATESTPERSAAEELGSRVVDALRQIYDPEIPVNIYDLGLIYKLAVDPDSGKVAIEMTLTAPGCPVAQTFPGTVEDAVREVPGVSDASVELVWDPHWTQDRMSEATQLQLGLL